MSETIKNHQIKITVGTGIAVLLIAIRLTSNVGGILNSHQNQLEQFDIKSDVVDERSRENKDELENLSRKCQETEVSYAEIKTRLLGIEAMLVELKQSIK